MTELPSIRRLCSAAPVDDGQFRATVTGREFSDKARLTLFAVDPVQVEVVGKQIVAVDDPDELLVIRQELKSGHAREILRGLRRAAGGSASEGRFQSACALAAFDPAN